MRLWAWIGVLVGTAAMGAEHHTSVPDMNLVDVMSTYPELSTLMHHLQRTRLIPTLNRMQLSDQNHTGITIFAPTNSAFEAASMYADDFRMNLDNVQAQLRQHLLYHVLNFTASAVNATYLETMHLPSRKRLYEPTQPGRIPQKPLTPPDDDTEDLGGLLGGHGQLLRVKRSQNGTLVTVGVDSHNQDGARIVRIDKQSAHGELYIIDRLLPLPPRLDEVLRSPASCELFRHMTNETLQTMATTAHLTVFLPTEHAWGKLNALERAYLLGPSLPARDDRMRVFGWHASSVGTGNERVAYASTLRASPHTRLTTILGGDLEITMAKNGSLSVSGMRVVEENLLIENGVVHFVDGIHLPFGDLGMTPEKYLLALNATDFVSLMKRAGLDAYISQDPHEAPLPGMPSGPFTLLVPSNEALHRWHAQFTSFKSTSYLQRLQELLRYHILPGHHRVLGNASLPTTELYPPGLRGLPQRMSVSVENDQLFFGMARVRGKPVYTNTTTIYVLDDVAQLPTNPVLTIARASLSKYVRALDKLEMDRETRKAPLMTYVVPSDDAMEASGLVSKYLMQSTPDLEHFLRSCAVPGVWYAHTVHDSWKQVLSKDMSPVWMRRDRTGLVMRTNMTAAARVTEQNILTDTGVMHVTDRLVLPPSTPMTLARLAQGARTKKMTSLLQATHFDWVWNSTYSFKAEGRCGRQNIVLLMPEDRAFAKLNMSVYEHNIDKLRALMALHILIVDNCDAKAHVESNLPLPLVDEIAHASMLDRRRGGSSAYGQMAFRQIPPSKANRLGYVVGIKGARSTLGRSHSANIVDYGRVTHTFPTKGRIMPGGILTIDTVLEPYEPGWLLRWDWMWKVCLLATLVACAFLVRIYTRHWHCGYARVQSEPLEGEEE